MDWSSLAGKLAQMGLPMLGRALGGPLGGTIGGLVGNVIAKALGVEATPEAVSDAIEQGETTQVVATLRAVEAEAAVRWPALADIEGHERTAEVEVAKINAQASADIRRDVAENGKWASGYRPLLMYACTFNLIWFGGLFFYSLMIDAVIWNRMVEGYIVVSWWIGGMATILGFHFFTRGQERKAAVQQPTVASSTVTTTTNK